MAICTVPWPPTVTPEQAESLWYDAFLMHKLHRGQLEMELIYRESKGKLLVLDCSRQLGKSTWAAKTCVEVALSEPGSKVRYATAFLTDLEQFIIPAFEFIMEDMPDALRPKWSVQKSEYTFNNGSTIRLIGLDRKPNGLRGNKLRLIVLDEAGYIRRLNYLYQSVLVPATTHEPRAKIIMASTQPEEPDHDFIGFCDRAELEGCYARLTVHQNPLLTPEQIDELAQECGGVHSTAFRREYLCERIVEEGRAVLPEFRESDHVVTAPRCPAFRYWLRVCSLDTGVRDLTAYLYGYYDFARAKLVIEDEFVIKGFEVTTRRIADLTREVEMRHGSFVPRRFADNDNLILLQDLSSEFDLSFSPTSKDDLAAMVNKVRLWLKAGRIEINPRCVRLIGAIKSAVWNEKRDQFARSKVHGHYDCVASLIYLVRNCPEHENPVPEYFGKTLSDVIYPQEKKTNAADVIKKAFSSLRK